MPDGSSLSEQSMSAPDEFSDATGPDSTTTSSTTFQRTPRGLDLENLSPRGQAIRTLLGDEMSDGYNLTTLAKELELSPSSASALVAELRRELELQAGPVPELSHEEYAALKESIKEDGVRVPVIIGEHSLIDGRHRWRVSQELGIKEIPAIFLRGLTAEQEHDACVQINVVRRQLTRDQRQTLIRVELQRNWARSSRSIAAICGVSTPTVESMRQRMRIEAETVPTADDVAAVRDQVSKLYTPPAREEDVRVTASGQEQRAYPEGRGPMPQPDMPLGYVECAHGQRHAIFKDGDGYRIEGV